jgi:signal transduction histidine kinase
VDLPEVAAEAARGSAALHPELSVRLLLDRAGPARGDAGRLRQVLANLLANAAQAGARTVEIRGENRAREVRLVVRDDGAGVARGVAERLFDPYATGRAGGTGLGLAVSRRIVERHGGTLSRIEAGGPGAAFELLLPRLPEEA